MEEMIIVEDVVTEDCFRRLHVMSNSPINMSLPMDAMVKESVEGGAHHFRAEWPFRGMLDIQGEGWPQAKRMAAWSFEGCANVTEALMQASVCYEQTFGCKPQYGFVQSLPRGVENGRETGPLLVFEAEWMLERAVTVA
jgi:hypothetical protein